MPSRPERANVRRISCTHIMLSSARGRVLGRGEELERRLDRRALGPAHQGLEARMRPSRKLKIGWNTVASARPSAPAQLLRASRRIWLTCSFMGSARSRDGETCRNYKTGKGPAAPDTARKSWAICGSTRRGPGVAQSALFAVELLLELATSCHLDRERGGGRASRRWMRWARRSLAVAVAAVSMRASAWSIFLSSLRRGRRWRSVRAPPQGARSAGSGGTTAPQCSVVRRRCRAAPSQREKTARGRTSVAPRSCTPTSASDDFRLGQNFALLPLISLLP